MDTTGKVLWRHQQRAPFVSATLATAGGLLLLADYNRYMYAFDVKSGKVLWQTRLATTGHGFPMTYAVNGRQYIAMPIGVGTPWIDIYGKQLMPEIPPARPGNAVVVFALPRAEGK
jgi:alcohol dehydrogenase (cytochrome c)